MTAFRSRQRGLGAIIEIIIQVSYKWSSGCDEVEDRVDLIGTQPWNVEQWLDTNDYHYLVNTANWEPFAFSLEKFCSKTRILKLAE